MLIRKMKLVDIIPADYNPRKDLKPGDPEYEKIKASIERFDLVEPLVFNDRTGRLVGGHQRLKVLKEKGVQEVEVSVVDLPLEEEMALNIALNKITGEWDYAGLAKVLGQLDDDLLRFTGFEMPEIQGILDNFTPPEEPFVPQGKPLSGKKLLKVDWEGFDIWHAEINSFMYSTPQSSYLASFPVMDERDLPPKGPKNRLFVDSGFLTGHRREGLTYLQRQGEIVEYAKRNGADWCAMMDFPISPGILKMVRVSAERAYDYHLQNARDFYRENAEFTKVYVLQSITGDIKGYKRCLADLGGYIKEGDIIAIGGLIHRPGNEQITLLSELVPFVAEKNPGNGVHLFGVTRPNLVAYLSTVGATSCDSSTGSMAMQQGSILLPEKMKLGYRYKALKLNDAIGHSGISHGKQFLFAAHNLSIMSVEFSIRLALMDFQTNGYGLDEVLGEGSEVMMDE